MFSRNKIIINSKLQKEIKSKTLLIIGCGLGGNIAEIAVRTGFKKLIIADGDIVEESNLNRQIFNKSNIGKSKSKCLANYLRSINPKINLKVINKFLDSSDIKKIIKNNNIDFVINTIDFDNNAFIQCNNLLSKHHNIIEIFPMNLGFGSSIILFKNKTLQDFFSSQDMNFIKNSLIKLIIKKNNFKSLHQIYQKYIFKKPKNDPQIGIASYLTGSLTIFLIIEVIKKSENIKFFPKIYSVQLDNI